jgi:hypothetical protein
MPSNNNNSKGISKVIAEARRAQQEREKGYRERALKLFPHICGKCGREFIGKKLRELTVHHKDHNHDNNPPDGSNWELLCIYCHDNEHERNKVADAYSDEAQDNESAPNLAHNPFDKLGDFLKKK